MHKAPQPHRGYAFCWMPVQRRPKCLPALEGFGLAVERKTLLQIDRPDTMVTLLYRKLRLCFVVIAQQDGSIHKTTHVTRLRSQIFIQDCYNIKEQLFVTCPVPGGVTLRSFTRLHSKSNKYSPIY